MSKFGSAIVVIKSFNFTKSMLSKSTKSIYICEAATYPVLIVKPEKKRKKQLISGYLTLH